VPTGFFDQHPEFYGTGNAGPVAPESVKRRLNARHDVIIEANAAALAGRTVVDLGSHDGRWTFAALQSGAKHATGIEPRQELVTAAQGHLAAKSVDPTTYGFVVGDALSSLAEGSLQAEVLLVLGVFYHFSYHVELLEQLRATGAQTIIIDTLVGPPGPQGRFANSISFIAEPVDDVSNASNEIYPGAGVSIVGFPSRRAMTFLFNAFGYDLREIDWAPYVAKWGVDGIQDYQDRSRGTFVANRLSDADARRMLDRVTAESSAAHHAPTAGAPAPLLSRIRGRVRRGLGARKSGSNERRLTAP
jgi:hypothetical protein